MVAQVEFEIVGQNSVIRKSKNRFESCPDYKTKIIMEKQVIISKTEFDEMEQDLKDLKEIVNSRTISAIVSKYARNFPLDYWIPSPADAIESIKYISGTDENQAINDLAKDIEFLRKELKTYKTRVWEQDQTIRNLNDEVGKWKKLPWYSRLFIK